MARASHAARPAAAADGASTTNDRPSSRRSPFSRHKSQPALNARRHALAATGSGVHVVRPDGHLAAVLPGWDAPALAAALRRATGWDQGAPPQAAGRDAATSRQTAGPCRDTGLSRPTPAP